VGTAIEGFIEGSGMDGMAEGESVGHRSQLATQHSIIQYKPITRHCPGIAQTVHKDIHPSWKQYCGALFSSEHGNFIVGFKEGKLAVGSVEGREIDGALVGREVGFKEGVLDGVVEGIKTDGAVVGLDEGKSDGKEALGAFEGMLNVGRSEGSSEGTCDGTLVGEIVGTKIEGGIEGCCVGYSVGQSPHDALQQSRRKAYPVCAHPVCDHPEQNGTAHIHHCIAVFSSVHSTSVWAYEIAASNAINKTLILYIKINYM